MLLINANTLDLVLSKRKKECNFRQFIALGTTAKTNLTLEEVSQSTQLPQYFQQ